MSASQIDGRLVATAADIGAVRLSLLDDRLGNPREIAKLPLGFIADPAVFMADGARFVPIANDTGLVLHQFDAAWQPISSQQVATTSEPATGMTATQFGQTTLAVWSTQNTCNLMMLSTLSPNLGSQIAVPCAAPRIAAEAANGTATLVFEGGNAVRLMHISHTQMGGGSAMVRPGATSPRVVFDGQRYWVSYLDVRGDVIVGFVDGDGQVVSMSLAGPQPQHGAYELAMVDNAPWVFSLDATGYTAHRMCIVQEQ